MLSTMSETRVRTVLMLKDEVCEALRVEASLSGRDMSQIVNDLLEDKLSDTLELVRKRRAQQTTEDSPKRSRRKPSTPDADQES